ncbi:hypothetical protein PUR61_13765 [Streptomyces sp. BE20]|uniref:hypothetical protein n=1 Tax=Streptomyces sp. BE20 TaxID=3002525 RepID=UPI002E7928E5|nr:hypothetical protein [Streptomyces sp. BE20]MEE1823248.1 hypothetical protein [Streptomyces sp. BE20]
MEKDMVEARPRGEEQDAAGWDGVERRGSAARPAVPGRSRWWSPDRLCCQALAGLNGSVGASAAIGVARFLAKHVLRGVLEETIS